MERDLANEQQALRAQARAVEVEVDTLIAAGSGAHLPPLRRRLRTIARHHDAHAAERRKITDAIEERILRQNLVTRLGSPARLHLLDTAVILLILTVLGLLTWEFLTPGLSPAQLTVIALLDTAACALFLTDFFLRLHCARSRRWFWRTYWLDFVTSLPVPSAELLRYGRAARLVRVLRLARLLRFLRVLRALRYALFFWLGLEKLDEVLDMRLMKRSLLFIIAFIVCGSLVMLWAEGDRHAPVGTFADSIWWSFTTLVTGGFGDIHNPQTAWGRVLTVVLVLAGMTGVGVFTATLTSILVDDDADDNLADMRADLDRRLDALAARLDEQQPPPG